MATGDKNRKKTNDQQKKQQLEAEKLEKKRLDLIKEQNKERGKGGAEDEKSQKRADKWEKKRLEKLKEQRKERVENYKTEKRSLEVQESLTSKMEKAVEEARTLGELPGFFKEEDGELVLSNIDAVQELSEEAKGVGSSIISNYQAQGDANQALQEIDEQRISIQRDQSGLDAAEIPIVLKQLNYAEKILTAERDRAIATEIVAEKQQDLEDAQKEVADAAKQELESLGSQYEQALSSIPGGGLLGAMVGGGIAAVIAGFAIKALMDFGEENKKIREDLGISASHAKEMNEHIRGIAKDMENIGANVEDVRDAQITVAEVFGKTSLASKEMLTDMVALNKTFGVTADNAAKVSKVFQEMGASAQESLDIQFFVSNLAEAAKVAPNKVMADIAENASMAHTFFRGNVKELAKAAIEARRLGLSLSDVQSTADGILDIQSSLEAEMQAQVMLGTEINFDKARALMLDGKTGEAMENMLGQIEKKKKFADMDLFEKEAAAAAMKMEVGELGEALHKRGEMAKLSKEDRQEIENARAALEGNSDLTAQEIKNRELAAIKQEQMAASMDQMILNLQEMFLPVMEDIMSAIAPIVSIFSTVMSIISSIPGLGAGLITFLGIIAVKSLISAYSAIMTSFGLIPFGLGMPLAFGAIAMLLSMISGAGSEVDSAAVGGEVEDTGIAEIHKGETIVTKEISDAVKSSGVKSDFSGLEARLDKLIASVSQPIQVKLGNKFVNEVQTAQSMKRNVTAGLDNSYGATL